MNISQIINEGMKGRISLNIINEYLFTQISGDKREGEISLQKYVFIQISL